MSLWVYVAAGAVGLVTGMGIGFVIVMWARVAMRRDEAAEIAWEDGERVPPGTLEERLADCLAEAIDTPLLTLRDPVGNYPMELRLGSFNREVSERAAELLEEAGR
jgi:hypothetical protein